MALLPRDTEVDDALAAVPFFDEVLAEDVFGTTFFTVADLARDVAVLVFRFGVAAFGVFLFAIVIRELPHQ
jgi:hypothetical protein